MSVRESTLGVWSILKQSNSSVLSSECSRLMELIVKFRSLLWVTSLCLLLFWFLRACHNCWPAMQRRRAVCGRHIHTHIIRLCFSFMIQTSMCDDFCWYLCKNVSSLRFFMIYWLPAVMVAPSEQPGMLPLSFLWHDSNHVIRTMASVVANGNQERQSLVLRGVDPETCMIVFKNHWAQVNIRTTLTGLNTQVSFKRSTTHVSIYYEEWWWKLGLIQQTPSLNIQFILESSL